MTATTIATGPGFFAQAEVVPRGQTVTLTAEMVEASRDRSGWSWFDLIPDEQAQIDRWGARRAAPGPWPEEEAAWTTHGDAEWDQQHERARALAFSVADEAERAAALRAVRAKYGAKPTNVEIAKYAGDA